MIIKKDTLTADILKNINHFRMMDKTCYSKWLDSYILREVSTRNEEMLFMNKEGYEIK